MSWRVLEEVPLEHGARVYAEGWQSWSPATWYPAGAHGLRPDAGWQGTMRFRPGSSLPGGGIQAEGLAVVDPGAGGPVRLWATADAAETVASIRVRFLDDRVLVTADGPLGCSRAATAEQALTTWAESFAQGLRLRSPPRVWCSWYRYFEKVTVEDVEEVLRDLDAFDLPVDVVQVDDGWSDGLGAGLRPRGRFADLPALVDSIGASGRRTGLWLAPFLVGRETDLARRHPEWLVGDAGHNWGQDLLGLDLTHPGVREYLHDVVSHLRDIGVRYFKLDFLYAGALPGRRREDVSPIAAYRSGLELLREAAGPESWLVGCGAPLLPSVGLVDAMRVSPDTFHLDGQGGSAGLRGLMPLAARAWQHGRLWVNDPDCLVTRPSFSLREPWSRAVSSYGGLRSFSDRVPELDAWGLETTRTLLHSPAPCQFDDHTIRAGGRTALQEATGRLSTAQPGGRG